MIAMPRLSLGRWVNQWPDVIAWIMRIRQAGRRTGLRRLTSVN